MPKKKKKTKKEKQEFLIDWDLPKKSACRTKFYRELRNPKLKKTKSTQSVVLSNDAASAKRIHRKAKRCGRSNLYRVEKM